MAIFGCLEKKNIYVNVKNENFFVRQVKKKQRKSAVLRLRLNKFAYNYLLNSSL